MKQTTTIVGIVLERDGNTRIAQPVPPDELAALRDAFQAQGLNVDECNCGDEICWDGQVWRCAYGPSGACQWFRSDWGCQP